MRSRTKASQLELYSYLSLEPLITSITMLSICGGLSPAGMSFHMFILFRTLSRRLLGHADLTFVDRIIACLVQVFFIQLVRRTLHVSRVIFHVVTGRSIVYHFFSAIV